MLEDVGAGFTICAGKAFAEEDGTGKEDDVGGNKDITDKGVGVGTYAGTDGDDEIDTVFPANG